MVHIFLLYAFVTVQIVVGFTETEDLYYPDNKMVIGNLKRREVIPLNPYSRTNGRRRYGNDAQGNLNYRRTKDIREDFIDRRFEVNNDLSEAQLGDVKLDKDDNLDKLHNELRWLSLDTEEGIDQHPNMVLISHDM